MAYVQTSFEKNIGALSSGKASVGGGRPNQLSRPQLSGAVLIGSSGSGAAPKKTARDIAFEARDLAEELDPMLRVYRRGREDYASMLGEQYVRPQREWQAFRGSAQGQLAAAGRRYGAEEAFQAEQLRRYPTTYSTATDRQRASYKAAGIDDTRLYQPRTSGY